MRVYSRQTFINVISKQEIGTVERTKERIVGRKHDMGIYAENWITDDQRRLMLDKCGGGGRYKSAYHRTNS
jgi:hypothetical protein